MKLTKQQCKREGFEKYVDLFLEWEYEGRTFKVRVQPVFSSEYKFLLAHAQDTTKTSA